MGDLRNKLGEAAISANSEFDWEPLPSLSKVEVQLKIMQAHTLIHSCIHARTHMHTYTCACTHIHVHAHIHTYMHACMHANTYTHRGKMRKFFFFYDLVHFAISLLHCYIRCPWGWAHGSHDKPPTSWVLWDTFPGDAHNTHTHLLTPEREPMTDQSNDCTKSTLESR